MFWNDPILYGGSFPYKDIPIQTPYMGSFAPWQILPKFVPPTFGYTPYQQFPPIPQLQQFPQFPHMMQQFPQFPHMMQQFPQLQQFPKFPFAQFPFAQHPFAQHPFAQFPQLQQFPQFPFPPQALTPFVPPFNFNVPFYGW